MSVGPSFDDKPEGNRRAMRLVVDVDLDLLPEDRGKEVPRILGFWAAWLPKMDLTQPAEHELQDSNYQAVGMLRLIETNQTDELGSTR
jgi:hypothetical protein